MGTKTLELHHPLHDCLAVANVVGYWLQNGRAVGLQLQFCDGHRASLTYAEIAAAQQADREQPQEAVCT